jgi:hypothetical protein
LDKNSSNKRLVIITGAQGSGNHLVSRLLSLHPDVQGWDKLLDEYWVPSDEEPLAKFFVEPDQLTVDDISKFTVCNVSYPFIYDGVKTYPKIRELAEHARSLGVDVTLLIVTRDATINKLQQERVRGYVAYDEAIKYYSKLMSQDAFLFKDMHFVSHETIFAMPNDYMRYLRDLLQFPILWHCAKDNIDVPPNSKYVVPVDSYWLDEQVWNGIKPKSDRGLSDN